MKKHSHEGIYSIDYYAYLSELKDLSPVFKVFLAVSTLILCVGFNNIYVSLFVILSMGCLTIYKGGLSFHEYLDLLTIPLAFMVLAGISIAAGFSKGPSGDYSINLGTFYIYSTNTNLTLMFNIMFKALGAVSALYMMALSTTTGEIISVFRKLHVPKIIIELMNMIYRFIFIIMDVQLKMTNSARARLGYVDYKTSIKTFGSTLSNLFIVSLKKASQYYNAMESRCYDGDILFLEEEKELKIKHVLYAVIYFVLILAIHLLTR